MDSKTLVLLLLFCLMFLHDASDITHAHAHVQALPSRKMMIKKENEWGGANGNEEEKKVFGLNEELRTVPSGPDPLHHHVNPPRQPRTDSHLP